MSPLTCFITAALIGSAQPVLSAEISTEIPIRGMSEIVKETELFGQVKWEAAEETASGDLQKNEQRLDIEARSSLNDDIHLKAIVRAMNETELESDDTSYVDLREFYLDIRKEWSKYRIGRQQVVWGKTDGLRLLDLINPQDFREFILDDFIDSRIPLWMARADIFIGDDSLQLLIIPDTRFSEPPDAGDRFEPAYLKALRASPVTITEEDEPEASISNTEIGMRYSGFANGWDYTINYFNSWEDNPLYFSEGASVIRRYKKSSTFGGSFSKAFGSSVLRGELAVTPDKYFSTTGAKGQVRRAAYNMAAGIDYTKGDWLISAQLFESIIGGYEDDIIPDERSTRVSLLLDVKFLNETLSLKLIDIIGLNDQDNVARINATYSITDEWKIMGGFSSFSGPDDSFFGQFDDADRAEVELSYIF